MTKINFDDFMSAYEKTKITNKTNEIRRKDFSDTTIEGGSRTIKDIDFQDFDFSGAVIRDITFKGVKFVRSNFKNTTFENVHFEDSFFRESDCSNVLFMDCVFDQKAYYSFSVLTSDTKFVTAGFEQCTFVNQKFEDCKWKYATFVGCTIEKSSFGGEDMRDVNFEKCEFDCVNFPVADLRHSWFKECIIKGTSFAEADLSRADLRKSDFKGTSFVGAKLNQTNFSDTTGLISPTQYLADNFEKTEDGYIAYKTFGTYYEKNSKWEIKEGSVISEITNFNPTSECGCGINVSTKDWMWTEMACNDAFTGATVWKVLIRWEWLAGVCVPYCTDGKIRCEKVELIEQYTPDQWGQIMVENDWCQLEDEEDEV